MMMFGWILFVALWAVTRFSSGVSITSLEVPAYALEGDDVHLRCNYRDEDGSSLYTLKWYKDGKEFFRHQPGISPVTTEDKCADDHTYTVDGVQVDCWVSTERDVVLRSISKLTSGDYQCEVIGEHPKFRKQVSNSSLTVFSEPLQDPMITGYEDSYSSFDQVSLNCSSTNREYIPDISWKVNGHPASASNVLKYADRRTVGLGFVAKHDLFRRGVISVTCLTSLGAHHTKAAEIQLTNRDYLSAQEYYFNSGFQRDVSLRCGISCLLFSVAMLLLLLLPSV